MFGALKRFMARFWLAKLFALLLAILLVVLIDRELRDTLFAEEVSLVSGEGITGNAISVSLPPGFVLLRESDAALTARLRVRGRRKDKSRLQLPFRASIPDERLASIGTDRSEWVSLEAADLNTGELKDAEISFEQPVRIPVAREDEAELELRGVPAAPLPDGVELAAEFTPARVWVRGPAPLLRKLNVLEIPLTAPQSEGGESREIRTVPADVQKRGVRWADEAPRITAVVRLTSREADTLEVPNVRIVVLRSLKPAFDFNLEPPYELEHMNVTLTGPRTSIARLRDDAQLLQRLRSELIVLVPAERAADRERTPIAPGERRVLEVRASLPSEALAPYGVTLSDKRLVVPVAVTRLRRVP
jgi:hypothetical protein